MLRFVAIAAVFAAAAPAASAQVDQAKVDNAIKTGAEFLIKKFQNWDAQSWNSTLELVMLTLSHANVPVDNAAFAKGLAALEGTKLQYTYRVAALAMALQRIDPVKYQDKIAHCAQWLVDTQLPEGEWGYPDTLKDANERPKPIEVAPPKLEKKAEPKPGSTQSAIKIKRQINRTLNLKAKGDISNAQFAILGLKACHDAGIEIPKATWAAALSYILKTQNKDGGWGYYFNGGMDPQSYSSMTCAGICSIAICRLGMGSLTVKEPTKDAAIQAGLRWLAENFKVDENHNITKSRVADPERWLYYYLYSIERVGKILSVEKLGSRHWYELGAEFLIGKQRTDGSWYTGIEGEAWKQAGDIHTADTCFAILFLTKATPPLVETGVTQKK